MSKKEHTMSDITGLQKPFSLREEVRPVGERKSIGSSFVTN